MPIKALLLDLDATLYASWIEPLADKGNQKRLHDYVKRKEIASRVPQEAINRANILLNKKSPSFAIEWLSRKYKLNMNKFLDYVGDMNPEEFGIRYDRKLVSLLSELSKHYLLMIISNSDDIWVNRATDLIGLKKIIPRSKRFATSAMKGHLKPDPRVFRIVMQKFNLKASEILFFDDRVSNLAGARKVGIKSARIINDGKHKRKSIYSVLERIKKGELNQA